MVVVVLLMAVVVGVMIVLGTKFGARGGRLVGWLAVLAMAVAAVAALSWLREDGTSVGFSIVFLAVPAIATLVPAAARGGNFKATSVRWGCVVVLAAHVLIFGLSIGLYFAPAALLLFASALLRSGARPSVTGRQAR